VEQVAVDRLAGKIKLTDIVNRRFPGKPNDTERCRIENGNDANQIYSGRERKMVSKPKLTSQPERNLRG